MSAADIFNDCCAALADAATATDKSTIFQQASYDIGLAVADDEIDRNAAIDELFAIGRDYAVSDEDDEQRRIIVAQFHQADCDRRTERQHERGDAFENDGNGNGHDADATAQQGDPLPYVDLAAALTERQWLVADRIPMFNVTLFSGEGAVGKSDRC